MHFSFKEAYKIFRKENEDVIISFMTFYQLKPGNIKPLSNTPILGCLCSIVQM